MAAFIGVANIAEQALVAATAETVLQLVAASNHRVKLLSWGLFFDGVVVTDAPVEVRLMRQTTAGTSAANTPRKYDDSIAETLQTTARDAFTAEPTSGDVLEVFEIHPQQGILVMYPLTQEPIIGGADRIGIEVTAPQVVNARAFMKFEE